MICPMNDEAVGEQRETEGERLANRTSLIFEEKNHNEEKLITWQLIG